MKRIGALIYDAERDCYLVRYNMSVYTQVPENTQLTVLGGIAWVEVPLIRSWEGWRLLGICMGDMTGICVLIDINEDGRYLPNGLSVGKESK